MKERGENFSSLPQHYQFSSKRLHHAVYNSVVFKIEYLVLFFIITLTVPFISYILTFTVTGLNSNTSVALKLHFVLLT